LREPHSRGAQGRDARVARVGCSVTIDRAHLCARDGTTAQRFGVAPPSPTGGGILSAQADPAAFARILAHPGFAEIDAHPQYGQFGRSYHPAIHGDHDCSFAVFAKDAPALICLCAPLNGVLGLYGMPLKFIFNQSLNNDAHADALAAALGHIEQLMARHGLTEARVLDHAATDTSLIGNQCRVHGGTSSPRHTAYVDLSVSEVGWRAALRKSSRSLINWGKRNLSISYVNRDAPARDLFDLYRAFHAEVAGRVTRSERSWDAMYEWITQGGGELVMAHLAGQLVAGSLFVDGTEVCIYASGVYDRTQFDKPLAHYPVWLGVERAHARGMRWLELGEIPEKGAVSDKEYQIGYFKRGFATDIVAEAIWRLSPK